MKPFAQTPAKLSDHNIAHPPDQSAADADPAYLDYTTEELYDLAIRHMRLADICSLIPRKYREDFTQAMHGKLYVQIIRFAQNYINDYSRNSPSLWLQGITGSGKTMLAYGIARQLILNRGLAVQIVKPTQLFQRIQATYNREAETTAKEIKDELNAAQLLIIDDMGTGKVSEFTLNTFLEILDWRDEHQRPIIVTSNLSIDELEAWKHNPDVQPLTVQRIISRLHGMFQYIQFPNIDHRRQS